MKALLASKLFLAIAAGAVTVIAVIAVTVTVLNNKEQYRVIKVMEVNGSAVVSREKSGELEAYNGMTLESGDRLVVGTSSTVRLVLDSDKFILLEPNTELVLEATGDSVNSKTTISLLSGGITSEITTKLSDSSAYEVNVPKATMAVRGTVFRVFVEKQPDGTYLTRLETYEGSVITEVFDENNNPHGEPVSVKQYSNALIQTYTDNEAPKYAEFVFTDEQIDYSEVKPEVLAFLYEINESNPILPEDQLDEIKQRIIDSGIPLNETEATTTTTPVTTTIPVTTVTTPVQTTVSVTTAPPITASTTAPASATTTAPTTTTAPVTATTTAPTTTTASATTTTAYHAPTTTTTPTTASTTENTDGTTDPQPETCFVNFYGLGGQLIHNIEVSYETVLTELPADFPPYSYAALGYHYWWEPGFPYTVTSDTDYMLMSEQMYCVEYKYSDTFIKSEYVENISDSTPPTEDEICDALGISGYGNVTWGIDLNEDEKVLLYNALFTDMEFSAVYSAAGTVSITPPEGSTSFSLYYGYCNDDITDALGTEWWSSFGALDGSDGWQSVTESTADTEIAFNVSGISARYLCFMVGFGDGLWECYAFKLSTASQTAGDNTPYSSVNGIVFSAITSNPPQQGV